MDNKWNAAFSLCVDFVKWTKEKHKISESLISVFIHQNNNYKMFLKTFSSLNFDSKLVTNEIIIIQIILK
jgi:hypothetical protein